MGQLAPYRISWVPPGVGIQLATIPVGSQMVFAERGGLFLMQPQRVPGADKPFRQRTPPAVALFAGSVADGDLIKRCPAPFAKPFGYEVAGRRGGSGLPPPDPTFGEWWKEVQGGEGPISRWIATTLRRRMVEFLERRHRLQPSDAAELFDQAVSRLFSEEPAPHPLVPVESLIKRWTRETVRTLHTSTWTETAVGSEISHGVYDPEARGMGAVHRGIVRMATEAMEGSANVTLREFLRAAQKERMREALEKAFYAVADERARRVYDALRAGKSNVEITREEGITHGMLGSRKVRMWVFLRRAFRSIGLTESISPPPVKQVDSFLARATEMQLRRTEALLRGESATEIARREGISAPTIFKLKRRLKEDFGVVFPPKPSTPPPQRPRRVVARPPRQVPTVEPARTEPTAPRPIPPERIETAPSPEDPERMIGAWLPLLSPDLVRALEGVRRYVLGWETLPVTSHARRGGIHAFSPHEQNLMLAFELLDRDLPRAARALRWSYSQTWDAASSLIRRCGRYKEQLAVL